MKASERLRELDDVMRGKRHVTLEEQVREGIAAQADVLNALPLIADVLAIQEKLTDEMWTVQNGDDGTPFVSAEGCKFLTEQLEKSHAALTALTVALEGDTPR